MILLIAALMAQNPPDVAAQECRPRAGLPNFLAKAATPGAELTVAYFGGSITAQAGWRPKTLEHFRKTWPQAKFAEINAAIGGTGSDLGVFRLAQDVLEKKPDLLFVEFAVNDGAAAPDQIRRCMEGIVRQTRRARPDCDVCFVYTVTEALVGPLLEGKFPRAAATMEEVADRYGIPSIHLAIEVAKRAKEGTLAWRAPLSTASGPVMPFANDGVHPYPETGHVLYLEAIVRSLDPIRAASKSAGPHPMPEPLIATNYERARLVPITEAAMSAGFEVPEADFAKRWSSRMPAIRRARKAGETLTFRFKGTRCAIYDLLGPDLGQVTVTLDDAPPKVVSRFDGFSTYHRLGTLFVGSELPDAVHTVKIELHPEAPDKAKILAARQEKMDKPERFEGTCFYPGAILLVGELVK